MLTLILKSHYLPLSGNSSVKKGVSKWSLDTWTCIGQSDHVKWKSHDMAKYWGVFCINEFTGTEVGNPSMCRLTYKGQREVEKKGIMDWWYCMRNWRGKWMRESWPMGSVTGENACCCSARQRTWKLFSSFTPADKNMPFLPKRRLLSI